MSVVCVLGAGAGGLATTAELIEAGHEVWLWNRSPGTLAANVPDGALNYRGVLGTGKVRPAVVTTDLALALYRAEVAVVCLPSLVHGSLFAELRRIGCTVPLVLHPGHTGGALHAAAVFGRTAPQIAECSTLAYVARVRDGVLDVSGRAGRVWAGAMPGGRAALDWALELVPGATVAKDVLFSSLCNVNLVLHPPCAVLGAAWVEHSSGDFRFYADGTTDGVARVMGLLDGERSSVAAALGHEVPDLRAEMNAIGTAGPGADLAAAVRAGAANACIPAPDSMEHRYYREDLPFGVRPFCALAAQAGVEVPVAHALLTLGSAVAELDGNGLDGRALGIAGMSAQELITLVRE